MHGDCDQKGVNFLKRAYQGVQVWLIHWGLNGDHLPEALVKLGFNESY